jgi:hypothetical protein
MGDLAGSPVAGDTPARSAVIRSQRKGIIMSMTVLVRDASGVDGSQATHVEVAPYRDSSGWWEHYHPAAGCAPESIDQESSEIS